jgi:hypothetical protein
MSNPEVQAQNILMCKLGATSENKSPDVDALKAYNDIFQSPLVSVQCKAIRVLFMMNCPLPSVDLQDIES